MGDSDREESKEPKGVSKLSIDEMLTSLHLWEDEEEEIVLEEELEELEANARWLALGWVFMTRSFSHGALYGDMCAAWNLA